MTILFFSAAYAQEVGAPVPAYPQLPSEITEAYENFDSAPYAKQIKTVEDYLSSFKTLEARFSQTTIQDQVGVVHGRLYLARPGKMRLEYLAPEKQIIVVNGKNMMYHDVGLDQVSYGRLPDTPFEVLLYETVSFDGNSRVVGVMEDEYTLSVTIKPVEDGKLAPTFVSLTLVFQKEPMRLLRIVRADATNHATTVTLLDTKFDNTPDDALFSIANPKKK